MKKVYGLIRRLGANSKYKGYFFVAEAVKISMGYQYKPLRITKDIYPCLAKSRSWAWFGAVCGGVTAAATLAGLLFQLL